MEPCCIEVTHEGDRSRRGAELNLRQRLCERGALWIFLGVPLEHQLFGVDQREQVACGAGDRLDLGGLAEHAERLDVEPDLVAQGDQVLLRQVLIGLLTNAFKNTPPPGTVRLRARRSVEDDVLIEVSDTGTGISEEEVSRVFERFYRGSGALEQEGFGLGLSIAKRMVDVMGGEIGVASELGRGSTFWVRLPVAKPAATPVA